MSYVTVQQTFIIDSKERCDSVLSEYINKEKCFVGLDCEWKTNTNVSLLQIATPEVVLLFRVFKIFPDSLIRLLQNPNIIKAGVNIQEDGKRLRKQHSCVLRGWLDLRYLAVNRECFGRALVRKMGRFEEELNVLYGDDNQMKDELKQRECQLNKRRERFKWSPKLGLNGLAEDCVGQTLAKTSSARWQDDWEADVLSDKQRDYAAADAAVALDILVVLCRNDELGSQPPKIDYTPDVLERFSETCSRWIERPWKQKAGVNLFYALIITVDKTVDLYDYTTKPPKPLLNKATKTMDYDTLLASCEKKAKIAKLENLEGKDPPYLTSKKALYDNCTLYAPDGSILCTCNKRKIRWYLDNDLAELIEEKDGEPSAAKLLFEPSGRPADPESDFYCLEKVNQCCCCGNKDKLVRKNVIPQEYRRHFPREYKDRQSHDIVLLCVQCHRSSNIYDNMMRENIAYEYNIPLDYHEQFSVTNKQLVRVRGAARALVNAKHKIPEERISELTQVITEHLGHEPSPEDLAKLKDVATVESNHESGPASDHGTEVIKKVLESGREREFIVKWRNFFVTMLKPMFLPTGWSVDHRTRCTEQNEQSGSGESSEMNSRVVGSQVR